MALRVGEQIKLTAQGFDQFGRAIDTGSIGWQTSNSSVVSLMGNGNIRGQSPGQATVTATTGGRSASASVQVTR